MYPVRLLLMQQQTEYSCLQFQISLTLLGTLQYGGIKHKNLKISKLAFCQDFQQIASHIHIYI